MASVDAVNWTRLIVSSSHQAKAAEFAR